MKLIKLYKTTCWFTLFFLTACGGGGGGGGTSNNPSSVTQSSKSSSSQPNVAWIDTGSLGSDVLIVNEQTTGERSIERLKEDGTSLTLAPQIVSRSIAKVRISPDGKKVAYLADQQTDNRFELFVSNTEGTFNVKISAAINGGDITDFSWSDNSSYLIYKHEILDVVTYYQTRFDGSSSSVISYKSPNNTLLDITSQPEFIKGGNNYRYIAGTAPEQHVVLVDASTNQQISDTTISDNLPVRDLSPDGKYSVETTGNSFVLNKVFIRDIKTNQAEEIYSGDPASNFWSPVDNKLLLITPDDLFIYDANTKSMISLLNLADIHDFSWTLLWYNGNKYLIFQALDDLFIVPTDGSNPVRARQTLGLSTVYSTVRWHDVSTDNKLLLITYEGGIYTMNLDGSNAVAHTELRSTGGIKYGFWLADNKSFVMQNYDTDLGKNVVTKVNLENATSSNISGNRDVACFLIASPSKSDCVLFFDER